MRVWLLHIGEQLPVDGPVRPFRYGYLAKALQKAGHEVLRWAPTFCHDTKTHRFSSDRCVPVGQNYAIQFVHSPGYRRNAGLDRLRTYHVLGQRFRELASREVPPDVIVAAIPSLEWAVAAVEYGRAYRIPTVVDVRDLWPDVFPGAMPFGTRTIGRMLLAPYRRFARHACQQSGALAAVSKTYLEWALRLAGRTREDRDAVVPLGYEPIAVGADALRDEISKLRGRGIDPQRPTCFFAGGLVRHHDVETVIEAARRLRSPGRQNVQFVICGDGPKGETLREQSEGLSNFHFLGRVNSATLQAVASISVVGLCAYARGAMMSLGNKPFEYMAGRLAIVSSLPGELAELLERHKCGVTYRAGDAASLTNCLAQLLDNPARLEEMRSNAYETWQENYRSSEIYARFVNHLTTLTTTTVMAAA